ncbi:Hypothetical_protein [Hexamita inflata]|uniref:Hypothetical_protein n=1 Tax=Hexamita inflata TaxID=28002 RepID=A0AA86P6E9_9EUKA|nr:Hypothetical protein HINF_LOCUS20404 [Hexamita inflata]
MCVAVQKSSQLTLIIGVASATLILLIVTIVIIIKARKNKKQKKPVTAKHIYNQHGDIVLTLKPNEASQIRQKVEQMNQLYHEQQKQLRQPNVQKLKPIQPNKLKEPQRSVLNKNGKLVLQIKPEKKQLQQIQKRENSVSKLNQKRDKVLQKKINDRFNWFEDLQVTL